MSVSEGVCVCNSLTVRSCVCAGVVVYEDFSGLEFPEKNIFFPGFC